MKVPFVDLKSQYLSVKAEIDKAISTTINTTTFIGGRQVSSFEEAFAQYIGSKYCVGCANGTDAIEILLQAMEIGQGDEVLVPAISWIATSGAVSAVGATPVFVDVDDYFTINVSLIEEKITTKTRAIIPVHLYGQPANMPEITRIAQKYKLRILEDCAQAHGAEIDGQKVGTWGDCASFSFYPGKNLGAYGDAGGMVTNDDEVAEQARRIANHGQLEKHDHQIEGRNSRMDELQAAILNVKLSYLDEWTRRRIENAKRYTELLKDDVIIPKIRENVKHVFHLYVIRSSRRDLLQEHLKDQGIQTGIHYPVALPFLPCYSKKGGQQKDFPRAALFQNEILSLPMYPELSGEKINYVVTCLKKLLMMEINIKFSC